MQRNCMDYEYIDYLFFMFALHSLHEERIQSFENFVAEAERFFRQVPDRLQVGYLSLYDKHI